MVDGCFDPLHNGHIAYFREAASLGYPVVCSMQSDNYIVKQKERTPILREVERLEVLRSVRYLSEVVLIQKSTLEQLKVLTPKIYFKGHDWKLRGLPAEEVQVCIKLGVMIRFGSPNLNSSSSIIARFSDS